MAKNTKATTKATTKAAPAPAPVATPDPLIQFATRLPLSVHARMKVACAQTRTKIGDFACAAILSALDAAEASTGKRAAR